MFKNYLTYEFALAFERSCASTGLPGGPPAKDELLRCARQMFHHFNQSQYTKDSKERSRLLFVALTYLRDCKEVLDREKADTFEMKGRYEVLHGRLEQLCWDASKREGGQLRMIG